MTPARSAQPPPAYSTCLEREKQAKYGDHARARRGQRLSRCQNSEVTDADETVTLWRPTGPEELALVEASGWRAWPPRLPEQPLFYPVLNQDYAAKIARDWKWRTVAPGS